MHPFGTLFVQTDSFIGRRSGWSGRGSPHGPPSASIRPGFQRPNGVVRYVKWSEWSKPGNNTFGKTQVGIILLPPSRWVYFSSPGCLKNTHWKSLEVCSSPATTTSLTKERTRCPDIVVAAPVIIWRSVHDVAAARNAMHT